MSGEQSRATQANLAVAPARAAPLAAATAVAVAGLIALTFASLPALIAATAVILAVWMGIESLFSP